MLNKNDALLNKIKTMVEAEGIDFEDVESVLKSISETVLPSKLTAVYIEHITQLAAH